MRKKEREKERKGKEEEKRKRKEKRKSGRSVVSVAVSPNFSISIIQPGVSVNWLIVENFWWIGFVEIG